METSCGIPVQREIGAKENIREFIIMKHFI